MGAISFNIEAYSLLIRPRQPIERIVNFTGPANRMGVKHSGALFFYGEGNLPTKIGRIIRVNPTSFIGSHVTIYLPLSSFRDIYHVIQTESPVGVYAAYDNTNTPNATVDVTFFQLYSRDEAPGEGYIDPEAAS